MYSSSSSSHQSLSQAIPFPSPFSCEQLAKCLVAGGVFQRLSTNSAEIDIGDGLDFREFRRLCLEKFPFAEIEIQKFWEDAKISVTKDLRSPARCEGIWRVAREFERVVFGGEVG